MSGKLTVSVLFAVFALALSETTKETQKINKVNLTIYYEALCGDSAKFVSTQVYPLIANQSSPLAHYINVTFVPYGKATTMKNNETGMTTFVCHHGDEECVGNKYQACAIKQYMQEKEKLYKYINCTMTKGPKSKNTNYAAAKECAQELKMEFSALETCATGEEGTMELAHYGVVTAALSPNLTSVPEVTFNDVYSKEKHDLAMTNLKAALCKEIPSSAALAECNPSKNSAPSVLGASFLMMAVALASSRLY